MLYKKEGMPEEDELVLCTITNVQHHSVKLLQSLIKGCTTSHSLVLRRIC